ncbi:MAG: hypothetical protein BBJ57_02965 [Desulfobacterales bacterium PC51MH44]|nr:MAG: hypothetical protein BBJ57_02965 [Desulfobacterales bacterium PC51MH44]
MKDRMMATDKNDVTPGNWFYLRRSRPEHRMKVRIFDWDNDDVMYMKLFDTGGFPSRVDQEPNDVYFERAIKV